MATIPIKLDEKIVKRLDILVRNGLYKTRTEAIRDQIVKGLIRLESVFVPKIKPKHDKILRKLIQLDQPLNIITSTKTAVELVAEGRER